MIHCGTSSEEAEAYQEALYLLASTVEGAESWLWPCLIKALLDTTYAASVKIISNSKCFSRFILIVQNVD